MEDFGTASGDSDEPWADWVDDDIDDIDGIDWADPALAAISPENPEVRVEHATARAEAASRSANRQTAELWQALSEIVEEALAHPEVFLRSSAALSTADRSDYAVRAAIADAAVRTGCSETAVRSMADHARRLRACPELWAAFREGRVSPGNARIAAQTLGALPPESWRDFDRLVAADAAALPPARFRRAAQRARDRVHRVPITERHATAAEERRVALDHDLDGMSWLSVYLPSVADAHAYGAIDVRARDLAAIDGETRTLAQVRADVAAELLTGEWGGAGGRSVQVVVTMPVETLHGGDAAGTVDGIGAVPAQTARELAALGSSFARAAVDSSGRVLDIDPRQYRLPEALQRLVHARDRTCTFAGCTRPASACDIDHITEWQHGGVTEPRNLMCLCRHHHRLKSVTRWTPTPPDPLTGTVTWTSPTGYRVGSDPPPF